MTTRGSFLLIFVIIQALFLSGCGVNSSSNSGPDTGAATPAAAEGDQTIAFELTSSTFGNAESIPAKFTCDGDDVSPALHWTDPPAGTQSFALIMDDPDAPVGTWVHWVLVNLPADTRDLPEGTDPPGQSQDGKNSWGRTGYGGPCPPGGTHRYFFKLYALDAGLDIAAGASKEQLLQAIEGHVLAQTELMGTYSRQ